MSTQHPRRDRRDRLSLIADLLARAERSDSPAERELSLARAQKEAARHGIDLAEAAYANREAASAPEPEERTVEIGRPRSPGLRTFTALFLVVAHANDLKCLVARDGSRVFAHGMPSDIDMAETIYASLLVQMETDADRWLASGAYLRERRRDILGEGRRSPDAGVARRSFRTGFVSRTGELLTRASKEARREALSEAETRELPPGTTSGSTKPSSATMPADASTPNDPDSTRGTGNTGGGNGPTSGAVTTTAVTTTALALRAKEKAVEEFHQQIIKKQNIRGTFKAQTRGNVSLGGYHAGRAAAQRAHANRTRP